MENCQNPDVAGFKFGARLHCSPTTISCLTKKSPCNSRTHKFIVTSFWRTMETEHVNAKIYFFNFLSLINILAAYQGITKITSGLDTRNFFTRLLAQFLNKSVVAKCQFIKCDGCSKNICKFCIIKKCRTRTQGLHHTMVV